jgi:hypothetical protein
MRHLFATDMVKLKHNRVGLTADHTRMLLQVLVDLVRHIRRALALTCYDELFVALRVFLIVLGVNTLATRPAVRLPSILAARVQSELIDILVLIAAWAVLFHSPVILVNRNKFTKRLLRH